MPYENNGLFIVFTNFEWRSDMEAVAGLEMRFPGDVAATLQDLPTSVGESKIYELANLPARLRNRPLVVTDSSTGESQQLAIFPPLSGRFHGWAPDADPAILWSHAGRSRMTRFSESFDAISQPLPFNDLDADLEYRWTQGLARLFRFGSYNNDRWGLADDAIAELFDGSNQLVGSFSLRGSYGAQHTDLVFKDAVEDHVLASFACWFTPRNPSILNDFPFVSADGGQLLLPVDRSSAGKCGDFNVDGALLVDLGNLAASYVDPSTVPFYVTPPPPATSSFDGRFSATVLHDDQIWNGTLTLTVTDSDVGSKTACEGYLSYTFVLHLESGEAFYDESSSFTISVYGD